MNFQKIAVQLLIVLKFVTAIPDANSQQGNLRGPKSSTPNSAEPQRQFQRDIQSGNYGPIVSSDTLWQISQNYRPNSSVSIYQVMQAIFDLNPDAFEQQNINFLKNGSILRMPSESYISNVNNKQAQEKSQSDSQNLESSGSNQSSKQNKSTTTLNQTNELIDQKLVAIDEAQNRQFMSIRKQFAESIDSVQNILDENKKLFERLDKVNTDIDEMRSEEQQKSLQINQMGKSIEELLEKSRQYDVEKAAQIAEKETSWLDNPITLILLFTLPVLLALSAFAYWMIKRKNLGVLKPPQDDADEFSLDAHTTEMDALSEALSAELSGKSGDELDDEHLFGDDDLLDDVLAEELEEALDDSLVDEFDDDVIKEKFDAGSGVIEQDDLNSLFDEDDDVPGEADVELSNKVNANQAAKSLVEVQNSDEDSELSNILINKDEQKINAGVDDTGSEESESFLAPIESENENRMNSVVNDDEQPEISIDELLNGEVDKSIENSLTNDSEDISEDVLNNIDKEIASQNEELDSITGSLIDELEQVEQMHSTIPDDDDDDIDDNELSKGEEPQLDIQKLDNLREEYTEDLSADEFNEEDKYDEVEIDISEVLNDTPQSDESEPALVDEREELTEPALVHDTEELAEPALADETEELADETQELTEPALADETQGLTEPALADETQELTEPALADTTKELTEPALAGETKELTESALADETQELTEPALADETQELIEPALADETQELTEPALADESEELADPALTDEANELDESEAEDNAEELIEPVLEAKTEKLAELEPQVDDSIEEEDWLETELGEDLEIEVPANDDSTLDEDQLEKALQDFENEELDVVLADLTSNESGSTSSPDNVEFSANEFVTKDRTSQPAPLPSLDDIKSIEDFDDSELDNTFEEDFDEASFVSSQNSSDDLDDLPRLGDWLDEDIVKPNDKPITTIAGTDIIEELEGTSFDEMLESIDFDNEISAAEKDEDDTEFDIDALLDETPQNDDLDVNEQDTEDFLDVESLLNESVSAESDDEIDKALDLEFPLEPFVTEQDNLNMIDVDADDGLDAKLDLAHAYIEIGEEESAKELLDEILKKGSAEQIAEVKIILDKLN